MTAGRNLAINGDRLWQSLMEMARIGATEKGGVCRLTLTELDKQGRDLFARWCRQAGCTISVDEMGNMFARRPGRNRSLPPVGTGSHLDTQPTGGKFDGVYGVLAGLEVLRTLQDHEVETEAPIEVSVWTNEEGARFTPAMVGSGVYAGEFDLEESWAQRDGDGVSLGEALDIIGYKGGQTPGSHRFGAFFEAHIEQGPILETMGKTIGIVTAVQGMRWYDVTLTGDEVHAGPTPMDRWTGGAIQSSPSQSYCPASTVSHWIAHRMDEPPLPTSTPSPNPGTRYPASAGSAWTYAIPSRASSRQWIPD